MKIEVRKNMNNSTAKIIFKHIDNKHFKESDKLNAIKKVLNMEPVDVTVNDYKKVLKWLYEQVVGEV